MIAEHFAPFVHINTGFPSPTILDVTLRDGSFSVDFRWKRQSIKQIVHSLAQAQLPLLELGYSGGLPELHDVQDAGITADVPLELVRELADAHPSTRFALMVHPGSVKIQPNFVAMKQAGVNLVRFVYHHDWAKSLQQFLEAAQHAGLATTVNIALASRYCDHEALLDACMRIASWSPSVIYLADTCSAFYPNQVAELILALKERIALPLGFHAHDFLSLAFANSLAAAHAGADYIDVSLAGIGRGAGNLRAETWCTSSLTQKAKPYILEALLPALDVLQEYQIENCARQDLLSVVSGACNLTPPEEAFLRKFAHDEGVSPDIVACRYALFRERLPHLTHTALRDVFLSSVLASA